MTDNFKSKPLAVTNPTEDTSAPMLEKEPSRLDTQMSFLLESAPEAKTVDWRTTVPTVSQITRKIKEQVEKGFFDVWVKGQVTGYKLVAGHAYFSVKDEGAQLNVCFFKIQSRVKFQIKDGMEILIHGKVTIYEKRGNYQLVADAAEPVGVGALQLAFEQLKLRLQKEGLFDAKFKKRLPFLPKRIGVVTSATGAAVKDILKVLSRRFPDREVLIIPANVQGERAAPEIVAGIERAQKWNSERPERALDVLIVGRGGGSLEDLWPFNEEIVARAIFKCTIPIISAVGHEIDFTIADFVADLRAPTPSAAAEMVIPMKQDLQYRIETQERRLRALVEKRLEGLRIHLGHLTRRLVDPKQKIKLMKRSFEQASEKLTIAFQNRLRLRRGRVEAAAQMLDSLSPLRVIGRGYSLSTTESGKILRSVKEVQPGEKLRTQFEDGWVNSQVVSTEALPKTTEVS